MKEREERRVQLTLLTAATDDVLQEGVLRGHETPTTPRHHDFDCVGRNFAADSFATRLSITIRQEIP